VDSNRSPHVAYHDLTTIDPSRYLYDLDLIYAARVNGTWTHETAYGAGTIDQVQFVSLALDRCGNPHIAFYLAGAPLDPQGVYYATSGRPCVPSATSVSLKVEPRTLNLKSRGNWVTALLTTKNASATDVDLHSLTLNGVPVAWAGTGWNGTLVAKFDRAAFAATLKVGTNVITLAGRWRDGSAFAATDVILAIRPGK